MPQPSARERFLNLLGSAIRADSLTKLTLGKPRSSDPTLKNLFVRPVSLKTGPHFAFVWRHATRDVTKNFTSDAVLPLLEPMIGRDFLDAHLFTRGQIAQFESQPDGSARLRVKMSVASESAPTESTSPREHDRARSYTIDPSAPWLRGLGVTNARGEPQERMADKFRQIQKFAELLGHLVSDAFPVDAQGSLQVVDMGSGKGYLTFALADLLGQRASIRGIEARPDLVEFCNRTAREHGFAPRLSFATGSIADAPLDGCDVLVALHACDTATDDALARGIDAGARLMVVAPCCQRELRPQLTAPPVLSAALQHGIFQERQSEFVTDALRAQLLEWAGYRTKIFEFISTEHTAKNTMIAAIRSRPGGAASELAARKLREFAAFYGVRQQRLASRLGFSLVAP
jgi:SAM-dependent methyltransferase